MINFLSDHVCQLNVKRTSQVLCRFPLIFFQYSQLLATVSRLFMLRNFYEPLYNTKDNHYQWKICLPPLSSDSDFNFHVGCFITHWTLSIEFVSDVIASASVWTHCQACMLLLLYFLFLPGVLCFTISLRFLPIFTCHKIAHPCLCGFFKSSNLQLQKIVSGKYISCKFHVLVQFYLFSLSYISVLFLRQPEIMLIHI